MVHCTECHLVWARKFTEYFVLLHLSQNLQRLTAVNQVTVANSADYGSVNFTVKYGIGESADIYINFTDSRFPINRQKIAAKCAWILMLRKKMPQSSLVVDSLGTAWTYMVFLAGERQKQEASFNLASLASCPLLTQEILQDHFRWKGTPECRASIPACICRQSLIFCCTSCFSRMPRSNLVFQNPDGSARTSSLEKSQTSSQGWMGYALESSAWNNLYSCV